MSEGSYPSRLKAKKQAKAKETVSYIILIVCAVLVALALRFFVFELIIVDGPSMEPTLYTGEVMVVEKMSYHFRAPQKGEVIVCKYENYDNLPVVKRVIGVPGDKIEVKDGQLYINDILQVEPWFEGEIYGDYLLECVPENTVFVMGDNRNDSHDSRDSLVGPIPYKDIRGRSVAVIWPLNKISGIKHS